MIDTVNETTTCKACGRPIVQVPGGHRVRVYCNAACKMRDRRRKEERKEQERAQAEMRARWTGLLPETQQVLEDLLGLHGPELASRVAVVVRAEIATAKEQVEVAAATQKLRDQQGRLDAIQNVEERFRNDTRVRAFAPWIEKRAQYYAETPFGKRFLADRKERLLPPSASRSHYESIMRHTLHYSEEDLETFREAWREMLKTQF